MFSFYSHPPLPVPHQSLQNSFAHSSSSNPSHHRFLFPLPPPGRVTTVSHTTANTKHHTPCFQRTHKCLEPLPARSTPPCSCRSPGSLFKLPTTTPPRHRHQEARGNCLGDARFVDR